jgi:hypothetical protein
MVSSGFPEDTIFHSHRRENLKSYIVPEVFGLNLPRYTGHTE